MKTFFSNLSLAYRAEHIKLRGTAFYILSAIFGAASPIIYFLVMAFAPDAQSNQLPGNYYLDAFNNVLIPFANFFLPLLIIIAVSRLTQFDHKNGGWQLMETQPLRKTAIYFSKYLVLLTACVVSLLMLLGVSYLFSWILSFIKEIPETASVTFEALVIFKLLIRMLVASLFLVAIQYVISVLIPSFIWSILIGFAGMLAFLFLSGFGITPDWYPYEIISRVPRFKDGSEMGYWFTYTEVVGVVFTIVILYLGFQWYRYKRLKLAFLRSKQVLFTTLAVVIALGVLIAYLLLPNSMEFHNRTMISGRIETDGVIRTVYIKGLVDTLAIIPVKNNSFNAVISVKMPFGKYTLIFDRAFQQTVFMGDRDSTFVEIKYYFNQPIAKIKGTRLAENLAVGKPDDFLSFVPYWIDNNQFMNQPERISNQLYDEWNDAMGKSSKFRTVDNYVPKEDFTRKFKTLTTIKLLGYWNDYQKKRVLSYDTTGSGTPKKIAEMQASVSLRDETMLIEPEYLNYVLQMLVVNNKDDVDIRTKQLNELSKVERGPFKDNLLYWVLGKGVFEAQSEQELGTLISYVQQFENQKYARIIEASANLRSGLSRGKPAPYFEASTPGNQMISLRDFEGKLTVIDVWATWCGPCWIESPYFEKFAIKYKAENIQFVALSTDQKRDAWLAEANGRSKSVIQLHLNDINRFSKAYDLQGIPRFILIDASGKILNASMPLPSSSAFEIIIRKELGLGD